MVKSNSIMVRKMVKLLSDFETESRPERNNKVCNFNVMSAEKWFPLKSKDDFDTIELLLRDNESLAISIVSKCLICFFNWSK